MSTVNNGAAPDNRKTIYGILIAALVLTWGYIFYDKSQTKETIQGLETKISNVDSARMAIQQEFMNVSAKADSLTKDNLELQGDLAERNADIQKLKGNISSILKKRNATEKELAEATEEELPEVKEVKKSVPANYPVNGVSLIAKASSELGMDGNQVASALGLSNVAEVINSYKLEYWDTLKGGNNASNTKAKGKK